MEQSGTPFWCGVTLMVFFGKLKCIFGVFLYFLELTDSLLSVGVKILSVSCVNPEQKGTDASKLNTTSY